MNDKDLAVGILIGAAKNVLADVQQRCTEALKALEQNDYLVVIGALAGLEEQLRFGECQAHGPARNQRNTKTKSHERRK